jgi:hypothetical protein
MGRVATAVDLRLGRRVAIKDLRPGGDVPDAAARLVAEAQLTAGLDHPGIVAVHDAGRDSAGQPWYAMRLVRGETLTRLAAAAPDQAARLRLIPRLLAACHAVAHAHERGIVHRDLKPDNLLAGPHGETQVADWGLAATLQTAQRGGAVGTRGFMAPEVAASQPATPQSDVYSLGACLVSVLCGGVVPTDLPQQLLALPAELRAIASRCLQADPAARYPNAAELAEDLTAWLDGRRVTAHDYSTIQLAGRLVRAWRWPLAVAAAGLAVIAAVAWQGWCATVVQRDRAVVAERDAVQAQQQAEAAHRAGQRSLAQAYVTAAERADVAGARPEAEVLASAALALGPSADGRGLLAKAQPGPVATLQQELPLPDCLERKLAPGGDWLLCLVPHGALILDARSGQQVRKLQGNFVGGALAASGQVVVLTDIDHQAHWFHVPDGQETHVHVGVPGNQTLALDESGKQLLSYNAEHLQFFGPSGHRGLVHKTCPPSHPAVAMGLAAQPVRAAVVCLHGKLIGWGADGQPWSLVSPVALGIEVTATALTLTADGDALVGSQAGGVWWRGQDLIQRDVNLPKRPRVQSLVSGPTGQLVAVLEGAGPLVWQSLTQAPVRLPHQQVHSAAVSPSGDIVLAGKTLQRWRLSAPVVWARSQGTAGFAAVAVAPTGTVVAAGGGEGTVVAWDGAGSALLGERVGGHTIKAVAFSATGDRLWVGTLGSPGLFSVDMATGKPQPLAGSPQVRRMGLLPADRLWLLTYANQLVLRHTTGQLQVLGPSGPDAVSGTDASARADGAEIVVADIKDRIQILATAPPYTAYPPIPLEKPGAVTLTRAGGHIAVAQATQVLWLQRQSGAVLWSRPTGGQRVEDLLLSQDDSLLFVADRDGLIRVLQTSDGRELARLAGHSQRVAALTLLPDGDLLSVGWDGAMQRWQSALLQPDLLPDPALISRRWGLTVDQALTLPVR